MVLNREEIIWTPNVTGGNKLIKLLEPALRDPDLIKFDILSAYFNAGSLIALGESLDFFLKQNSKIRIVIGKEDPDFTLLKAATVDYLPEEKLNNFERLLSDELGSITNELGRARIAVLAFLMKKELLQIKIAVYRGGRYHPKTYILEDVNENSVVIESSANSTVSGFERNWEKYKVFTSWGTGREHIEAEDNDIEVFNRVWHGQEDNLNVRELNKEFAEEIIEEFNLTEEEALEIIERSKQDEKGKNIVLEKLQNSPIYIEFNNSQSALYPHQINAVKHSLKTWPVRTLFSDEVGLGKTLELGFLIEYMLRNNLVENVLILCPAQLTKQWQKEMHIHFGRDFYRYERKNKKWIPFENEKEVLSQNFPIKYNKNSDFPNLAIMSTSIAARHLEKNIFDNSDSFPEFLVLDEAHHARQQIFPNKQKKQTLLREILDNNKERMKHVAFATATPLRTQLEEYYYLLEILGLDEFINLTEYMSSLDIVHDHYQNPNRTTALRYLTSIYIQLKRIIDASESSLVPESDEFFEIYSYIKNNNEEVASNEWLFNNAKRLVKSYILWHPTKIFTARNTQASLKKLDHEIYSIPDRNIQQTPIKKEDMTTGLVKFQELLDGYIEQEYYITESALDSKKKLPKALRKKNLQERFSSSIWAAKKSVSNRIENLEKILISAEQNVHEIEALEKLLEGDLEEIETNDIERVVTNAEIEIQALTHIHQYLIKEVIEKCPKEKNPDPKINALIEILSEHFQTNSEKPILIFSKYTDTLSEVKKAVIEFLNEEHQYSNGYAVFTGQEKKLFEPGFPDEINTDKDDITYSLEEGRIKIVFCSSAAGEGLNLQAASTLINIDVPWVAADLEQRIGRIARLGQKEKIVNILNIWYPNAESEMYKRIIYRASLGSLVVGESPPLVSTDIKESVEDNRNSYFYSENEDLSLSNQVIDELNDFRNSSDMKNLQKLWTNSSLEKITYGNNFRKELIDLMKKMNINTEGIGYKCGERNVLNFNISQFEEIFDENDNIDDSNSNGELFSLEVDNLLWGFIYILDEEPQSKYLLDPSFLNKILDSLLNGSELEGTNEKYNKGNLKYLLNQYNKTHSHLIFPNHYLLKHSIQLGELNLGFTFDNELKEVSLGKIKIKN